MRRRELLALVGGAALFRSLAAVAQQKTMPLIGFLAAALPGHYVPRLEGLRQGLGESGYVEGKSVAIEYRWAEGHYERMPALAGDLIAHSVDLIVAAGVEAAQTAKSATSTIPIVFVLGDDPVADGLVANLARPAGNLTGVTFLFTEMMPKLFGLLCELVPDASAIALLVNPHNPQTDRVIGGVMEAARAKRVELHILKAGSESEIDAAFASLAQQHDGGLVVGADPFFGSRQQQLVAAAARYAVPTIYDGRPYVAAGGWISYGASPSAAYHQAGIYAARILKGEKPADLPVQQPTKFELVINMKTVKALGLTVPQVLLAQADEIIE
jgi:putative ABC transport system substrate-binding protein